MQSTTPIATSRSVPARSASRISPPEECVPEEMGDAEVDAVTPSVPAPRGRDRRMCVTPPYRTIAALS